MAEADDRAIWQYAQTNRFVIVSQDADFADMATLYGPPPKVIWLRCGNQANEVIEMLLRKHAEVSGHSSRTTPPRAGKSTDFRHQSDHAGVDSANTVRMKIDCWASILTFGETPFKWPHY
ncbi:MAG TPA: DUF5615 family PIN-like protein [Pyrinomonadaceae bacterium]|jgi:hypothetical protein